MTRFNTWSQTSAAYTIVASHLVECYGSLQRQTRSLDKAPAERSLTGQVPNTSVTVSNPAINQDSETSGSGRFRGPEGILLVSFPSRAQNDHDLSKVRLIIR
jgi:hypothetical protein